MSYTIDIDLKTIILSLRLSYLNNPQVFHIYFCHPFYRQGGELILVGGLMPDKLTPFLNIQAYELVGEKDVSRYTEMMLRAFKMAKEEIEKLLEENS